MRWRQERAGHELSKAIAGMGHSRGWQPGPKVSTTIIRPPQQGQIFRSSCSPSARWASALQRAGSGAPRRRRANAMLAALSIRNAQKNLTRQHDRIRSQEQISANATSSRPQARADPNPDYLIVIGVKVPEIATSQLTVAGLLVGKSVRFTCVPGSAKICVRWVATANPAVFPRKSAITSRPPI